MQNLLEQIDVVYEHIPEIHRLPLWRVQVRRVDTWRTVSGQKTTDIQRLEPIIIWVHEAMPDGFLCAEYRA